MGHPVPRTLMSACVPEEVARVTVMHLPVFPCIQIKIPRLTHKECVNERLILCTLTDVNDTEYGFPTWGSRGLKKGVAKANVRIKIIFLFNTGRGNHHKIKPNIKPNLKIINMIKLKICAWGCRIFSI